ncbi:MAG TPA: cistern family PEP-CTERM protein [Myxococcota bacterium]|nr:cistern family PEP-CTERM protein [Myxococcota bacterium]
MKSLAFAVISAAALAAPASAVTVNGIGDVWSLEFDGSLDVDGTATVMEGLAASVQYRVVDEFYDASIDRTFLGVDITIVNQSDGAIWEQASVTGIGFNTDPDVKRMGSGVSGDYDYLVLDAPLPTSDGFRVELCVAGWSGGCSGPQGSGTEIGETGTASVYLAFAGDLTDSPIEFSNFGVRYSWVRDDERGIRSGQGLGVPRTPPVPEPASAAVFAVGALIVGAALRRRMRAS